MKLYKYVIPERIDVVHDLRIRFTPPGYLNDPFESRITFALTPDESETLSNRGHGEFDHDESIRLWRRMASFEWGILCLTKRPDNLGRTVLGRFYLFAVLIEPSPFTFIPSTCS